ncbi:hypothetical protein A2U01_0035397, partial [Trifolium medium]|nr:hypothetical protein [Trifolium medium]
LRRFIGIGKMRKAYEMHIEHAGYATQSYHHWMDDDTESLLYEGLSDEANFRISSYSGREQQSR